MYARRRQWPLEASHVRFGTADSRGDCAACKNQDTKLDGSSVYRLKGALPKPSDFRGFEMRTVPVHSTWNPPSISDHGKVTANKVVSSFFYTAEEGTKKPVPSEQKPPQCGRISRSDESVLVRARGLSA